MNTHYAITIGDSMETTLVAAGPEDFCKERLAEYLVKHPLSAYGRAEVVMRDPAVVEDPQDAEARYKAALAGGLSDEEAREEGWPGPTAVAT